MPWGPWPKAGRLVGGECLPRLGVHPEVSETCLGRTCLTCRGAPLAEKFRSKRGNAVPWWTIGQSALAIPVVRLQRWWRKGALPARCRRQQQRNLQCPWWVPVDPSIGAVGLWTCSHCRRWTTASTCCQTPNDAGAARYYADSAAIRRPKWRPIDDGRASGLNIAATPAQYRDPSPAPAESRPALPYFGPGAIPSVRHWSAIVIANRRAGCRCHPAEVRAGVRRCQHCLYSPVRCLRRGP